MPRSDQEPGVTRHPYVLLYEAYRENPESGAEALCDAIGELRFNQISEYEGDVGGFFAWVRRKNTRDEALTIADRKMIERPIQTPPRKPLRAVIHQDDEEDSLKKTKLPGYKRVNLAHEYLLNAAYAASRGLELPAVPADATKEIERLVPVYSKDVEAAMFTYLQHKADTSGRHRYLRPARHEGKLARNRAIATRYQDADDYLSDLVISVIDQYRQDDFKGINRSSEQVPFAWWLNAIFSRNFSKAFTQTLAEDKLKAEAVSILESTDQKKDTHDFTEVGKRSKTHGVQYDSSSDDTSWPQERVKSKALTNASLSLPNFIRIGLEMGKSYRQIAEENNTTKHFVKREVHKSRTIIAKAGVTSRETGSLRSLGPSPSYLAALAKSKEKTREVRESNKEIEARWAALVWVEACSKIKWDN